MPLGFSNQTQAVLPLGIRRKLKSSYLDEIRGQYGLATSSVISERARKQQEQLRSEDVAFREKELQSNISFQNQQIAAQNRQLQQQQQLAAEQAKQAQQANMLSTASLGVAAYPKLKDAYTGISNMFGGSGAATGGTSAAETILAEGAGSTAVATEPIMGGVTTGTETASTSGSGISSGLTTAGWVAAAIAGQHALANATDTVFEGQKTGDFFSRDDQGRWAPRFGNDPWHGYLNSQWGFGPSAGEKWDAAMYNGDLGETLRRTPAGVNQWLDPVGDFASDAGQGILTNWGVDSKTADALIAPLNPVGFIGDKIAESKDIGDFVNNVFNPFSWF